MSIFTLQNVKFKDVLSVDHLTIEKGTVTCIVGESGAGKSTLIKLLNKMITADSGTILFNGENLKKIDPITLRRNVVMLSQTPLIFNGTIEENLQLGLKFSEKEPATEKEMKKALEDTKLNKLLGGLAAELSGGEKQRLALARVTLMEPAVYILDEPTAALDNETESKVIHSFLQKAKKEQRTVIIVTHSASLAKTFGEHIITVKDGEII